MWTVAQVKPKQVERAITNLERQRFTVFNPVFTVKRVVRNRVVRVAGADVSQLTHHRIGGRSALGLSGDEGVADHGGLAILGSLGLAGEQALDPERAVDRTRHWRESFSSHFGNTSQLALSSSGQ